MRDYKSLAHTRWDYKYHIVFIPKRRQKLIYGHVQTFLGEVLANFRFSGVFNSNDPHSLVEFLQRTHKIEVVVGSDNITRIITVQ